jgi:hypothetical protein
MTISVYSTAYRYSQLGGESAPWEFALSITT